MSDRDRAAIIAQLLKLRSRGKPPFLVRNLRYVQACKEFAKRRVWDLSWTEPNHRAAKGPRHLVLTVRPSKCVLAQDVTSYLLNVQRPLPQPGNDVAYRPYVATLRVTLHVRQRDGHVVSFSTRSSRVRVWPQEHQRVFERYKYEPEDFSVAETFDLSAILPVLGTRPASLSLTVELWGSDARVKTAFAPVLFGEVLLWDCETSKHGSAIPNAFVKVPLGFVFERKDKVPSELVDHKDSAIVVSLEDKVMRRFKHMGIDRLKSEQVDKRSPLHAQAIEDEKGRAGSILLDLTGSVEKAISKAIEEDKPRISVQLTYKSPDVDEWHGITRNDFVCPWCHRNCHRYRALLAHFQVEHDEMKFVVQGGAKQDGDDQTGDKMPFTLEFTVRRLSPLRAPTVEDAQKGKRTDRNRRASCSLEESSERYYDYVYANPNRFGSYMMTKHHTARNGDNTYAEDSDDDDTDSVRTESLNPREDESFLSFVHEQIGSNCKVCFRHHNKQYNGKADFCSEWCEIIHRKKYRKGTACFDSDSDDNVPLQHLASVPRQKRINYKEAMGHLKLYHVVSVHEANVDLFEDDDPDSEEEVDQTWRLDLSLEAVRYLEGVSPKEKALWLMWNKFAHEGYPLPSFYGERYSRFTLELFALEYSSQIKQFKLRLPFLGFLRAMHRHGLIDSQAIKSIMWCLDGKKRRKDL